MTPHLVVCCDPNLGDAICAMGALQYLASQRAVVFGHFEHFEAMISMRPPNMLDISRVPSHGLMHVVNFNISQAINVQKRWGHPIQQYLRQANVNVSFVPQPKITQFGVFNRMTSTHEADIPTFDFIVAPFSKDQQRVWPLANYEALFDELRSLYPGCSIAVVGGLYDPKPWPGVTYLFGEPIWNVAGMMRKARRAVLTIDSGPNRLAHAAEIDNHVILVPDHLPEVWVSHPGAYDVYMRAGRWHLRDVLEAITAMPSAVLR